MAFLLAGPDRLRRRGAEALERDVDGIQNATFASGVFPSDSNNVPVRRDIHNLKTLEIFSCELDNFHSVFSFCADRASIWRRKFVHR